MNKYFTRVGAALMVSALMFSCKPETSDPTGTGNDNLPADFKYNTVRNIDLSLNATTLDGVKMQGAGIKIYTRRMVNEFGVVSYDGELAAGAVDESGTFNAAFQSATTIDTVYAVTGYPGLLSEVKISVKAGGSISGNMVPVMLPSTERTNANVNCDGNGYNILTCWDNNGVPVQNDVIKPAVTIPNSMLQNIYNTLPEGKNISAAPDRTNLLVENADLVLTQSAAVYVTFVSEAAGNQNAFGFFAYDNDKIPSGPNDVNKIPQRNMLVFPNSSLPGSGGNLQSGFKIKLGTFTNRSVGFFCANNGWDQSSKKVKNNVELYYSRSSWNPEVAAGANDKRHHMVLLEDPETHKIVCGVEDLNRKTGGSDHDFNDILFIIETEPAGAFNSALIPDILPANDTDQDGANNDIDQYPTDPTRAFNNYSPNATDFSALCYEDLWPSMGDFDMNDMVVRYNYNLVTSASNKAVELKAKFRVDAIGASYRNGFGVQFGVPPGGVTGVTYSDAGRAGTGLETAVTDKATVNIFTDAFKMVSWGGGSFYKTIQAEKLGTSHLQEVTVTFKPNTYTAAQLGAQPYNPFIYTNKNRASEVHLPDNAPTMAANLSLFGTAGDKSNPATGKYYRASNNMPFALHIPVFNYPTEKSDIRKTYLRFKDWAQSSGTSYADWYSNTNSGYRDASKIYIP
ncbi:MAG: LruC domain-containing protein [Bacteroidota bacterium]